MTWLRKEELPHLNSLYQIKEAIWKYEACKEIRIVHLTHLLYEAPLSKSSTDGNFSNTFFRCCTSQTATYGYTKGSLISLHLP